MDEVIRRTIWGSPDLYKKFEKHKFDHSRIANLINFHKFHTVTNKRTDLDSLSSSRFGLTPVNK